ncbi:MAG: RNase adapter RapZ [Thermaerobacter sp.]|nr:RNase adapter RapZ [Bacillota bacterium]
MSHVGGDAGEPLRLVIITGVSGAGKTEALRCFEDMGYFCIDNLPPALLPEVAQLRARSGGRLRRVAVVIDIRGGVFFEDALQSVAALEAAGVPCHILFLEAQEETLVRRYKETRRRHPLAPEGRVTDGIAAERARLSALRSRAQRIVDTSGLSRRDLRDLLRRLYADDPRGSPGTVSLTLLSFGFKYGLPLDADLVFDSRWLPNPYYVPALRSRTGCDPGVAEYVLQSPQARQFVERLADYLRFVLPLHAAEGREQLVAAVGCTGGRHRSVVIVQELARRLGSEVRDLHVIHRDMHVQEPDAAAAVDPEDAG